MSKYLDLKKIEDIVIRTPLFSFNDSVDGKLFEEALLIASPNLFNKYTANKKEVLEKDKNLDVAIKKYAIRSKYRATPFGLFGLMGTGRWSENASLVTRHQTPSTYTRLDMSVITEICHYLNSQEEILSQLKFYPNNTIVRVSNTLRYIEFEDIGSRRFHKVSRLEDIDIIEIVLNVFKRGMMIQDAIPQISNKVKAKDNDIEKFLYELINAQVLVSELRPIAIGQENLQRIEQILYKSKCKPTKLSAIRKLRLKLIEYDKGINRVKTYFDIYDILKKNFEISKLKNIIHVDSFVNFEDANINSIISKKIIDTLTFLNRINNSYENKDLENFKKEFVSKYGDREVPLPVALDPDLGITYAGMSADNKKGFLKGIQIQKNNNASNFVFDKLQNCLLKIIEKSYTEKLNIISITESDFPDIDNSNDQLPPTIAAFFRVIQSKSNKIHFINAGGSSAINLIGRFSNGNEQVQKIIKKIADFEKSVYQNCVVAELAHHSKARSGNVVNRTIFRDYEIPYVTISEVSKDKKQIPISDLYLSVKIDRLILRSKSLNKEVIPMMGSAHNFNFDSLPLYKFLCEFSSQEYQKVYLNFNWGNLSNIFRFLPRIEYKDVILSPATWRVRKSDFSLSPNEGIDSIAHIRKCFKEHQIPNRFVLVEGDNFLNLDLRTKDDVKVLISYLNKSEKITIEEDVTDETDPFINRNSKGYANQNIAFFLNKGFKHHSLKYGVSDRNVKDEFIPGTEWIYFKLYCGVESMDEILIRHISPVISELLSKEKIDKWFFIRYLDSNNHLRLRLRISDLSNFGEVVNRLEKLFSYLQSMHLIYNVSIDSYKREIIRYGAGTIELVETYFFKDSSLLLSLMDKSAEFKTLYSIAVVDMIVNYFFKSEHEQLSFISMMTTNFFNEHGGRKNLKVSLDKKYRDIRKQIHDSISNRKLSPDLNSHVEARIKSTKYIIHEINKLNSLEVELEYLVSSLIHMMINRLFNTRQRTQEFIIYYFLQKEFKSNMARKK